MSRREISLSTGQIQRGSDALRDHGARPVRRLANSVPAMAAEVIRLATVVPTMILVARALSPAAFGAFGGALALLAIAFPFSCWAVGHVLIRAMSRGELGVEHARGCASRAVLAGAGVSCIAIVLLGPVILPPLSRVDLVLLAASELIVANGFSVMGQICSAMNDFTTVARLTAVLGCTRFLGAILFVARSGSDTLHDWVIVYFTSSMVALALGILLLPPATSWLPHHVVGLNRLRGGSTFVLAAATAEINDDADKVALVHYGMAAEAGVYTIAYRLAALAGIPLRALLFVTYPRFFSVGRKHPERLRSYAVRQALVAVVPTAALAALSAVVVPFVVEVLGPAYQPAVGYLRWLVLIPILRAFSYYGADVLTGLDRQWVRAVAQSCAAAGTLVLLVLLVPSRGAVGAVVASVTIESALVVLMWTLACWYTTPSRLAASR
jgi:O-antigen/teichoic acid export membrane protein